MFRRLLASMVGAISHWSVQYRLDILVYARDTLDRWSTPVRTTTSSWREHYGLTGVDQHHSIDN